MIVMNPPIRTLLIDDHRHVHQVVETLLHSVADICLVGQGSNGNEAVRLCEQLKPDLILMDVVMPRLDGVQATKFISEKFPHVKILVLSSFQDHESVHAMLRNGAVGYLTKGELTNQLVSTIRTAHQGNVVLSPEIAQQLLKQPEVEKAQRFHLTDRELEVLVLMASGQTMKEIGHNLVISSATVKFHISNIQSKLGAQSRSEALIVAAKNNLV